MKKLSFSACAAVTVLALAGCAASTTANSSSTASSSSSASASTSAEAATGVLKLSDGWVKAADQGMTAAFGTVTNTGKEAVTITGASTSATEMTQLHVTEIDPTTGTSMMKETKEGFTVEPGATFAMEPGGSHVMMMDLTCSLSTGSTLDITLETTAGEQTFTFEVRDYQGAQEEYAPGDEKSVAAMDASASAHDSHAGHNHDGHDHDGHQHDSHAGHNHSMSTESASAAPACGK